MGTSIELKVGGISVDWAKNERGADHGPLFQETDRQRVRSDQIDYDYYTQAGEDPGHSEMALSRRLRRVVPRLELLGYTLPTVRRMYEQRAREWHADELQLREYDEPGTTFLVPDPLTFGEFVGFIRSHPLGSMDDTYRSSVEDSEIVRRFPAASLTPRIPSDPDRVSGFFSDRSYFGALIDFLHPYAVLRLLAECPSNLDQDVVWQYGPLVDAGWASKDEFMPGARRTQTVLIATEGTSDTLVLRRAIEMLRPDVADFFRFIDISERHPFSGTGGLTKFAEGLAKIDVHNKIVFLFDNDAEGVDAYLTVRGFTLPNNMRSFVFPDLDDFRQFPAHGPGGIVNADINGRAAAIECYLDLTIPGRPPAAVRWTNYKKARDVYQGALEYKESYAKQFLDQPATALKDGSYDVSKLERLLAGLIKECCTLAESVLASTE